MEGTEWRGYLDNYDFHLPEELIARYPREHRDRSRLLFVNRADEIVEELIFQELPSKLDANDHLIFNTTRVSPRKIALRRLTGGRISSLFLHKAESGHWACLLKGSGKLKQGETLELDSGEQTVRFRYHGSAKEADSQQGPVMYLEPVPAWPNPETAEKFFAEHGEPPLPPYMKRKAEEDDKERYQTVYARHPGSVAGPTAGFHFTQNLLDECERKGVGFSEVNLRIGYGTFAPLEERNFVERDLHTEIYEIPGAEQLNTADSKRRIAVGTTTLRALEANFRQNGGRFSAELNQTSIFIYPPDKILSIDGLITNFHLPRSSLFLLVCAFGGRDLMMKAYKYAIEHKFGFYSYGDAMLIL